MDVAVMGMMTSVHQVDVVPKARQMPSEHSFDKRGEAKWQSELDEHLTLLNSPTLLHMKFKPNLNRSMTPTVIDIEQKPKPCRIGLWGKILSMWR